MKRLALVSLLLSVCSTLGKTISNNDDSYYMSFPHYDKLGNLLRVTVVHRQPVHGYLSIEDILDYLNNGPPANFLLNSVNSTTQDTIQDFLGDVFIETKNPKEVLTPSSYLTDEIFFKHLQIIYEIEYSILEKVEHKEKLTKSYVLEKIFKKYPFLFEVNQPRKFFNSLVEFQSNQNYSEKLYKAFLALLIEKNKEEIGKSNFKFDIVHVPIGENQSSRSSNLGQSHYVYETASNVSKSTSEHMKSTVQESILDHSLSDKSNTLQHQMFQNYANKFSQPMQNKKETTAFFEESQQNLREHDSEFRQTDQSDTFHKFGNKYHSGESAYDIKDTATYANLNKHKENSHVTEVAARLSNSYSLYEPSKNIVPSKPSIAKEVHTRKLDAVNIYSHKSTSESETNHKDITSSQTLETWPKNSLQNLQFNDGILQAFNNQENKFNGVDAEKKSSFNLSEGKQMDKNIYTSNKAYETKYVSLGEIDKSIEDSKSTAQENIKQFTSGLAAFDSKNSSHESNTNVLLEKKKIKGQLSEFDTNNAQFASTFLESIITEPQNNDNPAAVVKLPFSKNSPNIYFSAPKNLGVVSLAPSTLENDETVFQLSHNPNINSQLIQNKNANNFYSYDSNSATNSHLSSVSGPYSLNYYNQPSENVYATSKYNNNDFNSKETYGSNTYTTQNQKTNSFYFPGTNFQVDQNRREDTNRYSSSKSNFASSSTYDYDKNQDSYYSSLPYNIPNANKDKTTSINKQILSSSDVASRESHESENIKQTSSSAASDSSGYIHFRDQSNKLSHTFSENKFSSTSSNSNLQFDSGSDRDFLNPAAKIDPNLRNKHYNSHPWIYSDQHAKHEKSDISNANDFNWDSLRNSNDRETFQISKDFNLDSFKNNQQFQSSASYSENGNLNASVYSNNFYNNKGQSDVFLPEYKDKHNCTCQKPEFGNDMSVIQYNIFIKNFINPFEKCVCLSYEKCYSFLKIVKHLSNSAVLENINKLIKTNSLKSPLCPSERNICCPDLNYNAETGNSREYGSQSNHLLFNQDGTTLNTTPFSTALPNPSFIKIETNLINKENKTINLPPNSRLVNIISYISEGDKVNSETKDIRKRTDLKEWFDNQRPLTFSTRTDPAKRKCGLSRKARNFNYEVPEVIHIDQSYEYPWSTMAFFKRKDENGEWRLDYLQTAVHIHPHVVAASAHYLSHVQEFDLVIRFRHWYSPVFFQDFDVEVDEIIPSKDTSSDLALLFFKKAVPSPFRYNRVCNPNAPHRIDFSKCVVTSWMADESGNGYLSAKNVTVITFEKCQQQFSSNNLTLPNNFVCAIPNDDDMCEFVTGILSCALKNNTQKYVAVGHSFGNYEFKCGLPYTFSVIIPAAPWITNTIRSYFKRKETVTENKHENLEFVPRLIHSKSINSSIDYSMYDENEDFDDDTVYEISQEDSFTPSQFNAGEMHDYNYNNFEEKYPLSSSTEVLNDDHQVQNKEETSFNKFSGRTVNEQPYYDKEGFNARITTVTDDQENINEEDTICYPKSEFRPFVIRSVKFSNLISDISVLNRNPFDNSVIFVHKFEDLTNDSLEISVTIPQQIVLAPREYFKNNVFIKFPWLRFDILNDLYTTDLLFQDVNLMFKEYAYYDIFYKNFTCPMHSLSSSCYSVKDFRLYIIDEQDYKTSNRKDIFLDSPLTAEQLGISDLDGNVFYKIPEQIIIAPKKYFAENVSSQFPYLKFEIGSLSKRKYILEQITKNNVKELPKFYKLYYKDYSSLDNCYAAKDFERFVTHKQVLIAHKGDRISTVFGLAPLYGNRVVRNATDDLLYQFPDQILLAPRQFYKEFIVENIYNYYHRNTSFKAFENASMPFEYTADNIEENNTSLPCYYLEDLRTYFVNETRLEQSNLTDIQNTYSGAPFHVSMFINDKSDGMKDVLYNIPEQLIVAPSKYFKETVIAQYPEILIKEIK